MRVSHLIVSAALVLPLGLSAQTTSAPGTVPVTSQPSAPLSKSEQKAQHKQQKRDEAAAKDSAKAAKNNARALKSQDKATNAAQKAQQPQ